MMLEPHAAVAVGPGGLDDLVKGQVGHSHDAVESADCDAFNGRQIVPERTLRRYPEEMCCSVLRAVVHDLPLRLGRQWQPH